MKLHPPEFTTEPTRPSVNDSELASVEAVLFSFASSEDHPVIDQDDFIRKYRKATGSGGGTEVFRQIERWKEYWKATR